MRAPNRESDTKRESFHSINSLGKSRKNGRRENSRKRRRDDRRNTIGTKEVKKEREKKTTAREKNDR